MSGQTPGRGQSGDRLDEGRLRGKLSYVRRYLADLHEEAHAMPKDVGYWVRESEISNAIDSVDRALRVTLDSQAGQS